MVELNNLEQKRF